MHIHSTTDFLIFVAKYSWDVSRDIIGHAVFRLCSRSPSFPQPLRPFGILIPQDHDLESESQTKSMANENHIIIPQTNYIYIFLNKNTMSLPHHNTTTEIFFLQLMKGLTLTALYHQQVGHDTLYTRLPKPFPNRTYMTVTTGFSINNPKRYG